MSHISILFFCQCLGAPEWTPFLPQYCIGYHKLLTHTVGYIILFIILIHDAGMFDLAISCFNQKAELNVLNFEDSNG